jgi:hypothetical protein
MAENNFSTTTLSSENVIVTISFLMGSVHRLAWEGPDEWGDRKFLESELREFMPTAAIKARNFAVVVDWWLAAALGRDEIKLAWDIARVLPGPLGEALFAILQLPGSPPLAEVRRPGLFRDAIRALEAQTQLSTHKVAAANYIIGQAVSECKTVLRAAQSGDPAPTGLRLQTCTDADIRAWASTTDPSSRIVNPNTPIWDYVVRALHLRAGLVRRAIATWPTGESAPPVLPPGWESVVRDALGPQAPIAIELIKDAEPEPGFRHLLAPLQFPKGGPRFDSWSGRLVAYVRETFVSTGSHMPIELQHIVAKLQSLQADVSERLTSYTGEAADALAAAEAALAKREADEATDWLHEADKAHAAMQGALQADRTRARASPRYEALARHGFRVPDLGSTSWVQEIDRAFKAALADLSKDIAALKRRSKQRATKPGDEDLQRFDKAHSQQDLDAMITARDRAREAIEAAEAGERERLGEALWAVRDAAADLPPDTRRSVEESIDRAVARREAGLSDALAHDLTELVKALRAGGSAPTIGVRDGSQVTRVAWVHGGVPAAGKTSEKVTEVRGALVSATAAAQVAGWGELIRQPGGPDRGGLFRATRDTIEGPYRIASGQLVPAHPAGLVAQAPTARFVALFGRVTLRAGPDLVPYPPTFDELRAVGGTIIDCLDDEDIATWLADALRGVPTAEALRAWLSAHTGDDVPPEVRESRLEQIEALLPTAQALAPLRDQALAAWLASDAGHRALAEAADRRVDVEVDTFRAAVEARQAELRAAHDADATRLAAARAAIAEEAAGLDAALSDARAELAAITELMEDRKLRLLVQLGGLGAARRAPAPPDAPADEPQRAAPTADEPLRAAPYRASASPDLPQLVKLVAGDTWGEVDVANLLLSVATGRWTLLAGLPGVGKSTFARSVLSRIGHGPATDRYLELVVRRDWQEDAPLFGFWHPTHARWTASSEGFVEHLLRANDGATNDGLWPVLIEELNLASPEYYLARVLSALEAADPAVRLYGPDLRPGNAGRYPHQIRVPDAVRMIGTVNVDDTVERLSPRFLSRTSVLWVEARHDAPAWRPDDDRTDLAIPFSALASLADRPAPEDAIISKLVRFLHDKRIPGAPTARTQRAIGRYLAAAQGTLPADEARDLQVVQRILPPLRGVGPKWRQHLDELTKELQKHGLRRSAERTEALRERGEELGDWYDFFHT